MTYWIDKPPVWQPSEEEYYADPAIGSSALALFARDREAFHRGCKVVMTDDMLRGRVVDCAITEPEHLAYRYYLETPERGEAIKWGFGEFAQNGQPVSASIWRDHLASTAAFCANELAVDLLHGPGLSQVCHRWTHPSGIECRMRLDRATVDVDGRPAFVDLKNMAIRQDRISAEIHTWGIHRQMALYSQGFADLWTPEHDVILVFVPPSGAWVESVELSREFLELGRLDVDADLYAMAECQRTGDWSNPRSKTLRKARPPRWAVIDSNERRGIER